MTKIEIRHRFTNAVLYTADIADTEANPLRAAVVQAVKEGVDLARANLARANLDDASLDDASLDGASLDGASHDPKTVWPSGFTPPPSGAGPSGLPRTARGAVDWQDVARRYRERHPDVPVIENLNTQILEAVTAKPESFDMALWHGQNACGTTHCLAGWAVALGGPAALELERQFDTAGAASRIFRASTGRVPSFYDGNERALAKLRLRAEEEKAATTATAV